MANKEALTIQLMVAELEECYGDGFTHLRKMTEVFLLHSTRMPAMREELAHLFSYHVFIAGRTNKNFKDVRLRPEVDNE